MVNEDVVKWFRGQLAEGFTKGQLVESLKDSGYTESQIEEVLESVETSAALEQPEQRPAMPTPATGAGSIWKPTPEKEEPISKEKPKKPKLSVSPIIIFVVVLLLLLVVAGFFVLPAFLNSISQPAKTCVSLSGPKQISRSVTICKSRYTSASIQVLGDDIIVDCNGSLLDGGGSGVGISINNHRNVIIRNCIVSNYQKGVVVFNSREVELAHNHLVNNTYGITLESSSYGLIHDNEISGGDRGIVLTGASENILTSNTVESSSTGMLLDETSNNNLIRNNAISKTENLGIAIKGTSRNNVLEGNKICNNNGSYDVYCGLDQYGIDNYLNYISGCGDGFGYSQCD